MSLYRRQSHLVYKTKQNKLFTLLSLPRLGRRSCLIPHSCDQGMTPRSGHISAIKGAHRGHRIVVLYPLSRLKQHAESLSLVSGCVCVISLGRASFGRHGQEYKYYSADPQFLPIFTIILTEKTMATMKIEDPRVWWTNTAFFIAIHVLALYATLSVSPWKSTPRQTLFMTFWCHQIALFGYGSTSSSSSLSYPWLITP